MERMRRKIICPVLFFLLLFSLVFSGCFLMPRNLKEFKKPLLKSINIDSNNIVTIVLDNTNKSKPIGEIHELKLFYRVDVLKYERNNNEIIIIQDISEYKEKFTEDRRYKLEINWFGGHLFLETIYKNGQFIVVDEHYINRI